MFRVALKMIGDHDDVSDIMQEVFVDLYGKLSRGNEIIHPRRWLFRATINKCIDNLRKKKRRQNIESIDNYIIDQESEKDEVKVLVKLAVSKLRPRERMLAVLYSEGLTYKEMSEATGIKYPSVGKLLSRTLKKLRIN